MNTCTQRCARVFILCVRVVCTAFKGDTSITRKAARCCPLLTTFEALGGGVAW